MSANDHFEEVFEQYRNAAQEIAQEELKHEISNSQNQESIVAVRKNEEGDLIAFKTSSGRELDYISALTDAKQGKLAHVDVFHKYGRDILRSEPDGIKENNLDHLPEF
ncbi:DUF3892 domain-containing protein [Halalkalibacter okhensis]|uniref:DUF3892 domain-containing protein n=1 Tax=Halalkalibacter okhensis TaxID=333138 RepID=A0A0B0IJY2_9BACI|nr:DUF3892 domain-containing protein [Halalkalibacter okhensis]KHF39976.1 hypothetical protein LQ50_11845 [Halalkalibacter okhensis]